MSETKKLFESMEKYQNIEKPEKINEELSDEGYNNDGRVIYMNTWANYNENGADLSNYGIDSGWMTVEEARAFASKYAEDEPFINDLDVVLPFEINEYSNVGDALDKIESYYSYDDSDRAVLSAIMEAGSNDYEEAVTIFENGDYIWMPDVETDADLGYAWVDMVGGISEVSNPDNYIDFNAIEDELEIDGTKDSFRSDYEYENGEDFDEDEFEEAWESYKESIMDEMRSNPSEFLSPDAIESYFDYESLGRDLGFDFTFVEGGAIQLY
jgi:hypothetical protein